MIGEVSTDLGEVGAPVKAEFEDYAKRTGVELGLEVEPGTYLVANAGALVSTIQDVACTKSGGGPGEGGHDFLKLDCGMTDVLRPSLYGAQHPLVVVAADAARDSDAATAPYVVVGHCCESGDLLTCAPDEPETLAPRELKACARGDLVVVESVGAYPRRRRNLPAAPAECPTSRPAAPPRRASTAEYPTSRPRRRPRLRRGKSTSWPRRRPRLHRGISTSWPRRRPRLHRGKSTSWPRRRRDAPPRTLPVGTARPCRPRATTRSRPRRR